MHFYVLTLFSLKGQVNGIWCSTKQEVELENTVKNEFRSFRPSVDEDFYTLVNKQFL